MQYIFGMLIGLVMVAVTIIMSGEKVSPPVILGCLALNGLGIIQLTACAMFAFSQLVRVSAPEEAVKSSG